MELNDIVKAVHKNAVDKGWHETERKPAEVHMLIVSEVAEATEEIRNVRPPIYQVHRETLDHAPFDSYVEPTDPRWVPGLKPEGEAIELADAVIRVMDYFGLKGWDLEETIKLKHIYNKTRPHRHGGKAL